MDRSSPPDPFGSWVRTVLVVVLVTGGLALLASVGFAGSGGPSEGQPATLSGEVDLDEAHATLVGDEPGSAAGYDLTVAGDVNGDGEHDILVTAPFAGEDGGAAYLFYGPVDPGEISVADADVTLAGAPGDEAGLSVAAGDLDGDDHSDVVVGAPFADAGGEDSGAVYVVDGGDLPARVDLSTDADATYRGDAADHLAGYAVATVGPQDERNALLVGAPSADSAGEEAGTAYLVREGHDGDTALGDAAAVRYVGENAVDSVGWAVADAGDLTEDGRHEVAIGAPFHGEDTVNAGAVYLLSTEHDGGSQVDVGEGRTLLGTHAGEFAGLSVSTAGDTNDDGHDDVVVGAPFNDATGTDAGAAYVVRGEDALSGETSLDDAALAMYGERAGDQAGWSVADAGSGDVVCNGYDDVLIGAPYSNHSVDNAGAAYVVAGGEGTGDRGLETAAATLLGESEDDLAGWSVAAANDTTGDGHSDVLVGAIQAEAGGHGAGAAYLLAGDCPVRPTEEDVEPPTPAPETTPVPTPDEDATEEPEKTPKLRKTPEPGETPTPTPTETPPRQLDLEVTDFAIDVEHPEDEFVELTNVGDRTIDLTDHYVRDGDGRLIDNNLLNPLEFPDGFTLDPDDTVTIWTRDGVPDEDEVFWDTSRYVWNATGDTIIIVHEDQRVFEQSFGETGTQTPTPMPTPTPTETPEPTPTETPDATQTPRDGDGDSWVMTLDILAPDTTVLNNVATVEASWTDGTVRVLPDNSGIVFEDSTLPEDAGTVTINVDADGYEPETLTVVPMAQVSVRLVPVDATPTPTPSQTPTSTSTETPDDDTPGDDAPEDTPGDAGEDNPGDTPDDTPDDDTPDDDSGESSTEEDGDEDETPDDTPEDTPDDDTPGDDSGDLSDDEDDDEDETDGADDDADDTLQD